MNTTDTRAAALADTFDGTALITLLDDLPTPALLALVDARQDATTLELALAERLRDAWDELARMGAMHEAMAVA